MRALVLVTRDRATREFLPFLPDVVDVVRVDTVHEAAKLDVGNTGPREGRRRDAALLAFGPDVAAAAAEHGAPRIVWAWPRIVLAADLPLDAWSGAAALGAQATVILPDGVDVLLRLLDDDPSVATWARVS